MIVLCIDESTFWRLEYKKSIFIFLSCSVWKENLYSVFKIFRKSWTRERKEWPYVLYYNCIPQNYFRNKLIFSKWIKKILIFFTRICTMVSTLGTLDYMWWLLYCCCTVKAFINVYWICSCVLFTTTLSIFKLARINHLKYL